MRSKRCAAGVATTPARESIGTNKRPNSTRLSREIKATDRQARREIALLRRRLKKLFIEFGLRGWLPAKQVHTALRVLGLKHE
jgi:hypothetical protein